MKLYRFRGNIEYALDELEKNYFYFALPNELNDPMEGFINMYWEGDIVLWKNFLKHYLYTLINTIICIYIEPKAKEDPLPIFFNETNFPTKEMQNIFEEIRDSFFSADDIKEFLEYLTCVNHKIYIQEMKNYLRFIQIETLSIILNVLKRHGLLNWNLHADNNLGIFKQFKSIMPKVEREYNDLIKVLFTAVQSIQKELSLSIKIDSKKIENKEIKNFILIDFPDRYIEEVKALSFSPPCVTCFMEDYKSPAFWGYYGGNHYGICLIFDDENTNNEIHFDFKTSWGGISCSTQKIKYQCNYPDVNFFRMLGALPLFTIDHCWLTDWEGNSSSFLRINDDYLSDDWRKEYNKNTQEIFSIKLPDWQKENEHRIILGKNLVAGDTEDSRKFRYDFNLLKGIIFGVRTPDSYKIKIMDVINEKCKNTERNDFKFYQTFYNESNGLLDINEIKI